MIQDQQSVAAAGRQKRHYNWKGNESRWCRPLHAYMSKLDEGQQKVFAKRCGTTLGNVRLMMYGNRGIKERFAIAFDRESGGLVPMHETRPDVDWGYVAKAARRKKFAPPIL